MWTDIGIIALVLVWLLVPVWILSTLYLGWGFLNALERQTEAIEDLVGILGSKDGMCGDEPSKTPQDWDNALTR